MNLSRISMLLGVPLTFAAVFYLVHPVTALTDTPMRKSLEDNAFGEGLIRHALYPKNSQDYFNEEKRRFVHGLPRVHEPLIYEPDVYTWELAMASQYKQIAAMTPPQQPFAGLVQPTPMDPVVPAPISPEQVQLTPLPNTGFPIYGPVANADAKMESLLARARAGGIRSDGQLRATDIKQRLLSHMSGIAQSQPGPSFPILAPQGGSRGKGGDSYDRNFGND